MSFRLFTISTMYPGSLKSFYIKNGSSATLDYSEHFDRLIQSTTEFAGSYLKTFIKLGVDAGAVIANDEILQKKWRSENQQNSDSYKNLLFQQVKNFNPDVLWIDNLSLTDADWLKEIRMIVPSLKLILAYHCSPFAPGIIARLKYVDFIITCTPGLKRDIEEMGYRAFLVYHGYDEEIAERLRSKESGMKHGLIFSGSLATGKGYHGKRIELIEKLIRSEADITLYADLEKHYRIKAKQSLYLINEFLDKVRLEKIKSYFPFLKYGETRIKNYSRQLKNKTHDPVYGLDMYALLRDSKVVLNYHIGVAGNYAGNMRMFEATGTGSCLLTDNKSNISDLFEPGREIVVYNNIEDCIDKAKWLLNNEEERSNIALAGMKRTLASHTVEKRCLQIIDIIEKELSGSGK